MTPAEPRTPVPILLLAALVAMAPLAIDAYLPALPTIAADFAVSIHDVELSLSLFLGGFALGQLIGGPFSDHFGRRYAALTGIGLFLLGTLGTIFSPQIHWMWLSRVLQAVGGGLAVVNATAVVRDLSSGRESAKNLSHMAVIMMIAPLLAPLIGMLLLRLSHWRGIFVFLFIYALVIGIVILKRLPETLMADSERPSVLRRYGQILRHRHALGYLFSQSFTFGSMFTFITASPMVYMEYFSVSETLYPFLFGANVLALVIMNRLNIHLLRRYTPKGLMTFGQLFQIGIGTLLVSYLAITRQPQLGVVVLSVILIIGVQGLIAANATASMVEFFPHNSATANALLGASAFLMGGICGSLVGIWGDGTPGPMVKIMLGCAIFGLLLRWAMHYGGPPATTPSRSH
ncbi:MAG: multidrug effflux MFS transporter [Candidatus Thiodiazotropha sp.]